MRRNCIGKLITGEDFLYNLKFQDEIVFFKSCREKKIINKSLSRFKDDLKTRHFYSHNFYFFFQRVLKSRNFASDIFLMKLQKILNPYIF